MQVTPLAIADVLLIEPKVFGDARGFFFESFNQEAFTRATGVSLPFVQDNRIHVVPPCVVTAAEVAQALSIYDDVIGIAERG